MMSDPDEYAAAIVQQYMHEHSMQSGMLIDLERTSVSCLIIGTKTVLHTLQCLQPKPYSIGCINSATGSGKAERPQICA